MESPVYPVYPSDLADAEWALLAALLPPAKSGSRLRSVCVVVQGSKEFLLGESC